MSLDASADTAPKIVEEPESFQFLVHQLPDKQLILNLRAEAEAQKKLTDNQELNVPSEG